MARLQATCKRFAGPLSTLVLVLWPGPAQSQGLPPLHALNPVATARSGLYFQPYVAPAPGWSKWVSLNYGSLIEISLRPDTGYVLDAEVLQIDLGASKDVDPNDYVMLEVPLGGAYDGFLDGFINWYHRIFGIPFPEREDRPQNRFDYAINPETGSQFRGTKSDLFLGDVRLGLGHRYSSQLQSHISITLPTSTGPEGYGRGTVSLNLINTYRTPLAPGVIYEGSAGLGVTPSHGRLAGFQKELFVSLTSGVRTKLWRGQSVFGNLFFHSSHYGGYDLQALDGNDLSLNFGWMLVTPGGQEWRVALSEDLFASGPGADVVVHLGARMVSGKR